MQGEREKVERERSAMAKRREREKGEREERLESKRREREYEEREQGGAKQPLLWWAVCYLTVAR